MKSLPLAPIFSLNARSAGRRTTLGWFIVGDMSSKSSACPAVPLTRAAITAGGPNPPPSTTPPAGSSPSLDMSQGRRRPQGEPKGWFAASPIGYQPPPRHHHAETRINKGIRRILGIHDALSNRKSGAQSALQDG